MEPLLHGLASPAEASFGQSGAAAAEFGGDLGLEESALVSGEASGGGTDQGVEAFAGFVHGGGPIVPNRRDGDRTGLESRIIGSVRIAPRG
jgi:hypothetical protein